MQGNVSYMLQFLTKSKNLQKLRLFVSVLSRYLSYGLIFFQMTHLMNVHDRGNFCQYSLCGCQIKSFKHFAYQIIVRARSIFQGFLCDYYFKYGPIVLRFATEVVNQQAKIVCERVLNIYKNRADLKFAFLVQL